MPPGPEPAVLLEDLEADAVANGDIVALMQAWSRQLHNPHTIRSAVALVYRRADADAMQATLQDLEGEALTVVNMALVGLASAAFDARPDAPDGWLNKAALVFAEAENGKG